MANTLFRVVRGSEDRIMSMPVVDGYIYFTTDSSKIYMDKDNTRIPMGNVGSAIYYGVGQSLVEDPETGYYNFPKYSLENLEDNPKENDIIINNDGNFFRILSVGMNDFECALLAVSGSGGGGPVETRPTLIVDSLANNTFINGQDASISFTATSAIDENGQLIDDNLTVTWTLSVSSAGLSETYHTGNLIVESGANTTLNFGSYLRESTTSVLTLIASGANHDKPSRTRNVTVTTSDLSLKHTSSFSNTNTYSGKVVLECNVEGAMSKVLDFYFDGILIGTKILAPNSYSTQSYEVPSEYTTHGYHTVSIELYQNLGTSSEPIRGVGVKPLQYEIAFVDSSTSNLPIIWLGSYQDTYYNYDNIQIPFLVYDPLNTLETSVKLYKNDIEIGERTISNFTRFNYWEIADGDLDRMNYYQISCGEQARKVIREIQFLVVQDPNRDMTVVKKGNLKLDFNPTGRSNNESATSRATWNYENITGEFHNFNWYNNGWFMDSEINQTCLRISNGARFALNIGEMTFGSSDISKQSNSIEMQIKVRNIQNYNNLISNVTRYENDSSYYSEFKGQNLYTNYDSWLQAKLTPELYESLVFEKVDKVINLNNVVCGFYSGNSSSVTGICVGPQDTFFTNGQNTVNVSFVENEIINLSYVYAHELKLLFIYINGVLTGVIRSQNDGSFTINSSKIEFNSEYCDIDLYRLRVYNTGLNVNDIVTNFAVDRKDVKTYDQNLLAKENLALKEYQLSYEEIVKYNEENPNRPLMPYIIYDTTVVNDNKLPWDKSVNKNVRVTFVNTPLERAYANGELEVLARADGLIADNASPEEVAEGIRTYYKHHCPSWTSTLLNSDRVEMSVQGTSSQFYPRKNFKIKTKEKKVNVWNENNQQFEKSDVLNIYLNRGPFADLYAEDAEKTISDTEGKYRGHEKTRMADGWYMNNYTNPTDRWTMKVDYMESSGSYNAGFVSMVGSTAYSKHPLQDYQSVMNDVNLLKSDVSGVDREVRWEDYRSCLLGFPVMAFQKTGDNEYLFIGYYRMLLDKGSDEVMGFKTNKKLTTKAVDNKRLRDVAECWEFATNSRTFCSFRDPWNRVELSFKAPIGDPNITEAEQFTADDAPLVMNHYEYRYHWAEDYLDSLFEFKKLNADDLNSLNDDLVADGVISEDKRIAVGDKYAAQDVALSFYKNWEDVNKWVWSTNTDNVCSQYEYILAPVGEVLYTPNTFYIIDEESGQYVLDDRASYTEGVIYFKEENGTYRNAHVAKNGYLYEPNKFYMEVFGSYSLVSEAEFNDTIVYYESRETETYQSIADLLITPAIGEYNSLTQYYKYDGSKRVDPTINTGAVIEVTDNSEEEFNNGLYYVAQPVTYGSITYTHDTKEYRTAKFINELSKHFDIEYLATYFILTEVFECYDSRGKNCMMATWGPQTEGGNYIWYPIFYDLDTQLGINNTGIPSFEFNVDATEAGNFSTSDSILWNNFYKYFKNSDILQKYRNLRGASSSYPTLRNPTLQSVDYIEGWYTFNPDVTKNIATRGDRPLIATNLDEYFKYITITNAEAINQGVAYYEGVQGEARIDNGSFFYALQGDRSQARRQFLTNRLEYIDSWLNQGNYQRGGSNRIRGRISANSTGAVPNTSDIWIETPENPYWVGGQIGTSTNEFGTKTNEFDAQYWLELTPIRSSYVTAGDDSANYPSKKFDGINTVKFKLNELEQGIRTSPNYQEQLVYIYGANQMSDFGDMSKLYWTEFFMEGSAPHLTKLKLGYDGLDSEGRSWFNKKLNDIRLVPLPLLTEANFCNIGLINETVLDLKKSEKLENFRATGTSNLAGVEFAEGVALNTLYLPSSVKALNLTQANLLTNLLKTKPNVVKNPISGELEAEAGLYLEGFFGNDFSSAINTLNIRGGALGYNSFSLLDRFYSQRNTVSNNGITLTDVEWSPYIKLVEGDIYNSELTYYKTNGHYGLEEYTYDSATFESDVLNGYIYYYNNTDLEVYNKINDDFINVLMDLSVSNNFSDAGGTSKPIITGSIYIHNTEPIEESWIRNELQAKYPNISFLFNSVKEAYSAEFLIYNEDKRIFEYVPLRNGTSEPSVQKISQDDYEANNEIFFTSPFSTYEPSKIHYDFVGWSTSPDGTDLITSSEEWETLRLTSEQYDYKFYAIFEKHKYNIVFYDYFEEGQAEIVLETKEIDYGTIGIEAPLRVPYKDDSDLPLHETYGFIGYTDNPVTNRVINLQNVTVRNNTSYYPVFAAKSVYDNINPDYFTGIVSNGKVELSLRKQVKGKITIPATFAVNGVVYPVDSINSSFASGRNTLTSETYEYFGEYLTHVFFAKGTTISTFRRNTFCAPALNVSGLKYVEFPSSLTYIGDYAFYRCNALDYSLATGVSDAVIGGENIQVIGRSAFQNAFVNKNISAFRIGSNVQQISVHAFYNINLRFERIILGTPDNLCKVVFNEIGTLRFTRQDNNPYSVDFYSEAYDTGANLGNVFSGRDVTINIV